MIEETIRYGLQPTDDDTSAMAAVWRALASGWANVCWTKLQAALKRFGSCGV